MQILMLLLLMVMIVDRRGCRSGGRCPIDEDIELLQIPSGWGHHFPRNRARNLFRGLGFRLRSRLPVMVVVVAIVIVVMVVGTGGHFSL